MNTVMPWFSVLWFHCYDCPHSISWARRSSPEIQKKYTGLPNFQCGEETHPQMHMTRSAARQLEERYDRKTRHTDKGRANRNELKETNHACHPIKRSGRSCGKCLAVSLCISWSLSSLMVSLTPSMLVRITHKSGRWRKWNSPAVQKTAWAAEHLPQERGATKTADEVRLKLCHPKLLSLISYHIPKLDEGCNWNISSFPWAIHMLRLLISLINFLPFWCSQSTAQPLNLWCWFSLSALAFHVFMHGWMVAVDLHQLCKPLVWKRPANLGHNED